VFGYQNFKNNNFELAEHLFRKGIMIDPTNSIVYRGLAELMFVQKRWMEAELYFDFTNRYHTYNNTFIEQSEILKKSQEYLEFNIYEDYINLYQSQNENDYYLGNIYENWGYPFKAIQLYKKLITTEKEKLVPYYKLWKLYERYNLNLHAEETIKKFKLIDPVIGQTELRNHYITLADQRENSGLNYYKAGKLVYDMYFTSLDTTFNYYPTYVEIPGTGERFEIQGWVNGGSYDENEFILTQTVEYLNKATKNLTNKFVISDCFKMAGDIHKKLSIQNNSIFDEEKAEYYYQLSADANPTPGNKERLINRSIANSNFSNALKELRALNNDSLINFDALLKLSNFEIKEGLSLIHISEPTRPAV
jgi:hypothetical protein